MTLVRALESKVRMLKVQERKQAISDYILADLIGISVSRVHNSRNKMPSIYEVYPTLFEAPEEVEEQRMELSAIRFKQFAQTFNNNFKHNEEVLDTK